MTPPTLRDALDSLALEWETEAARRTNDAKTRKGQERKALNVGAEFERHHAARIRSLLASSQDETATAAPAWCSVHQHYKWCEHNGGVIGATGYEAPPAERTATPDPDIAKLADEVWEQGREWGICQALGHALIVRDSRPALLAAVAARSPRTDDGDQGSRSPLTREDEDEIVGACHDNWLRGFLAGVDVTSRQGNVTDPRTLRWNRWAAFKEVAPPELLCSECSDALCPDCHGLLRGDSSPHSATHGVCCCPPVLHAPALSSSSPSAPDLARDGKGVVANPGTPASSTLLCVSCGKLPPYSGSTALCPACNGEPTPAALEILAACYGSDPAPVPSSGTPDPDTLHVYGQAMWHDDARIVGNRGALVALRESIDRAIMVGGDTVNVFVADGEGYHLTVTRDEHMEWADHYYDLPGAVSSETRTAPASGDDARGIALADPVRCPNCGSLADLNATLGGRYATCRMATCSKTFPVPAPRPQGDPDHDPANSSREEK